MEIQSILDREVDASNSNNHTTPPIRVEIRNDLQMYKDVFWEFGSTHPIYSLLDRAQSLVFLELRRLQVPGVKIECLLRGEAGEQTTKKSTVEVIVQAGLRVSWAQVEERLVRVLSEGLGLSFGFAAEETNIWLEIMT